MRDPERPPRRRPVRNPGNSHKTSRNPTKTRRQIKQEQEKKKFQRGLYIASLVLYVFTLAPTVAAVVVAFGYDADSSPCALKTDYTVDLVAFLYVAGFVSLGASLVGLCWVMIVW